MGVYRRGNGIAIVQTFSRVDPVTEIATPTDPTTVTFTIRDPDDVETSYVYGVDANVTKASTGVYVCELADPLPTGDYGWLVVGTGTLAATGEGTFTILESGVLPPTEPTVAEYGPCGIWVDGAYVANWDTTIGVGSNTFELDNVAFMASQLMYEVSGRQFPGICTRKVRPCRQTCSCFGSSPSLGLGPWYWTSAWWGGVGSWNWRNECGDSCGCGSESYVELAGYPVRRIVEVKIDGVVLPADPTAIVSDPASLGGVLVGGYRLDGRRHLIRLADMRDPANPVDQSWPSCQDMSLPDTAAGTYSVTYEWGADPPELGKQAAAQFASELWKANPSNQGECRLPTRVQRVARQGITMDRIVPLAELIRTGATGLAYVDAFIAMVNPQGARRRSVVWSPDKQPFSRQVGQ